MDRHLHHIHAILQAIENDAVVSQRTLSRRLGIALGLTNLLMRRVVNEKWVRVVRQPANRRRYSLTPAGVAAKERLARDSFEATLRLYAAVRAQVRRRLATLSAELTRAGNGKRVVFLGAGEVAEIAYLSLQETDLELAAIVDGAQREPFFGCPVHGMERLQRDSVAGQPFDCIIVTSADQAAVSANLRASGISPDRVFWIWMPGVLEKDERDMLSTRSVPC